MKNKQKYDKQYYLKNRDKIILHRKKWQQSKKGRLSLKIRNEKNYIKHRNIMRELKINGCAICGYDKCINALDFHHTNPKDKKFNLNIKNIGRTGKTIIGEVNKCILLCANCHRGIENEEE